MLPRSQLLDGLDVERCQHVVSLALLQALERTRGQLDDLTAIMRCVELSGVAWR